MPCGHNPALTSVPAGEPIPGTLTWRRGGGAMPLVRVDLRAGKPASYRCALGTAVQRAMVECLDVPARDQFQVISEHDADHLVYNPEYLDVQRTDDIVLV